jgi:energy-converting hydrogenase Eha subunit E
MLKTSLWGGEILEDWKIKLSVLWLLSEIAFLGTMVLGSLEPNALQQFLNTGEIGGMKITPELLILYAILVLLGLVMAFLTLTLKNSINRWVNIIVGTVGVALSIVGLSGSLAYAYSILMWVSKIVIDALIVWYAWKSKPKA